MWNLFCGTDKQVDKILLEDEVSISEGDLKKMTKKGIDDWAMKNNVTLDRRHTKDKMIQELKKHIKVT